MFFWFTFDYETGFFICNANKPLEKKKKIFCGISCTKAPFFLKGDLIQTFPFPTVDIFSAFPFGHWVS